MRDDLSSAYETIAGTESAADQAELRRRFEQFYRDQYLLVLRLVLSRTSSADHEAIVSEVFLTAWRHYLAGHDLEPAWLYGIVRNKLGDHYRYRQRQRGREVPLAEAPDLFVHDKAGAVPLRVVVQDALRALSPEQAEILVIAYWNDLSTAEGARALGLSQINYRVRLSRARSALLRKVKGLRPGRGGDPSERG